MSNILIIKHGSLGDLIQANGAIEDIKKSNAKANVVLLTTGQYFNFMSRCPHVDEVIIDKRLPRWNLIYLFKLKKKLSSYNFTHVFDLQNSNRTKFYSKYLISLAKWYSTETTLNKGQLKSDFDEDPVLKRMEIQLKKSGIKTKNVKKPNLNWAVSNIRHITKNHINKKYILAISTQPDEERQIITEWLKTHEKKVLLVVAPRHPERLGDILSDLPLDRIEIAIRSKNERIRNSTQIYIADTIGEIESLIAHCEFVFVGGSLVDHGGHNFLEAASYGKPSIGGIYGGEGDAIKSGKTGYLCNGNDLNALYDTLQKILENNHFKELGANALEFSKDFSWKKIVKKYIELI